VYTNAREVNAMLDLVKPETERIESRFLEPACGTGNFLVEILSRKLAVVESRYKKSQFEFERYAVIAVSSVYGIDILADNVAACQARLFELFDAVYVRLYKKSVSEAYRNSIRFILSCNILHGDALTLKTVTPPSQPIVFSEWSFPHNNSFIQQIDYLFEELVEPHQTAQTNHDDLFAANAATSNYSNEQGQPVYFAQEYQRRGRVHFLELDKQLAQGGRHV
jgi:hypothetical protein